MFARQGPKVRSACEECHGRKTKCVIGRDGGSCNACKANLRDCFFKPRFKSGRPYSSSSFARDKNNANAIDYATFDTSNEALFYDFPEPVNHQAGFSAGRVNNTLTQIPSENHNSSIAEPNGVSNSRGDNVINFTMDGMSPQHVQSFDAVMPFNGILPEGASPTYSPAAQFFHTLDLSTPTTGGHDTPPSSSSMEGSCPRDSTGSLTHSLISEAGLSTSIKESRHGDDALMLNHCVELQRELERVRELLREPNQSVPNEAVLQAISATISGSCKRLSVLVGKVPRQKTSLTLNTAILAIFMVGKALELSSLFAQSKIQTPCPLDYALFLKRLECNVMELQVSSPHIEQHQPVLSAAVDKCMEASVTILSRLHRMTADSRRC